MKTTLALLFVCVAFLFGCSGSNKVVLKSKDGSKQLVYDCNNFRPQVETRDDIVILVQEAVVTAQDAVKEKAFVSAYAISEAVNKSDIRELERLVVEYRCAHRK